MQNDAPKPQGYLVDAEPEPSASADAKLREKTAQLQVDYTDPSGRTISGQFTNQILNNGQRIKVDLARAQRSNGVAPESMSTRAYGLLYAICWLEQSIVSGPDWCKNLYDSLQEGLVGAIWEQVDRHERTFFGGSDDQEKGQAKP